MRIIFMGTPAFALPTLDRLNNEHDVVSVVTQPDRPSGRGRQPKSSKVKSLAFEKGLPIMTPASLKDETVLRKLEATEPDLIVVAAFGQILPEKLIAIPHLGSLNVHASLLPRWRGAAPIQAAIRAGDQKTGVTIMLMDAGLDTGPILSQADTEIRSDDTGRALTERLANLGARLLSETLEPFTEGKLKPKLQDPLLATYARTLKKSDGRLHFKHHDAKELERQVRAFDPWPGSFFLWAGSRIIVHQVSLIENANLNPGDVGLSETQPFIACAKGALQLDTIQPAGRRMMSGEAFLRGSPDFLQAHLDEN